MKLRDVAHYPQALIDATVSLLNNAKILNVLVMIVFSKTCAFETQSVVSCLDMVSNWFVTIHNNKNIMPASFDFNFFFKGI